MEKVKLVKGLVEKTIPGTIPASIALLRLDTDWYASTSIIRVSAAASMNIFQNSIRNRLSSASIILAGWLSSQPTETIE